MRLKRMMMLTLGCLLLWTTAAVSLERDAQSLHVGNKGEITLAHRTKVGNRELQTGKYVFQHRTSGDNHFIRFFVLKHVEPWEPGTRTYTEADNAGDIGCRIEPVAAPITETLVSMSHENGVDRITRIAIKRESVVHVF